MAIKLEALTEHERDAFWSANLQHALKLLATVKDRQVDLNLWCADTECGTIACFGGWCAIDPYFQSLGVSLHKAGRYPVIEDLYLYDFEVSNYLFGEEELFQPRHAYTEFTDSTRDMSDREIAIRRVTQRLRELGAEA